MKRQLACITLAVMIACGASFAAEQTWIGEITSSMCSAGRGMGHDCILNCIINVYASNRRHNMGSVTN